MSTGAISRRAVAAVTGGLVSDAAALPTHWIYDVKKLDEVVKDKSQPEFLPEGHCPFYKIPTGRFSCYGDQAYVLLESLVSCKGFDHEDYKKRLYAMFGPDSLYEGDGSQEKPAKHGWRNGSIRKFVENYKEGRHESYTADTYSDGLVKVAPMVALFAGRPEMESMVRDMVKITQADTMAVDAAVTCAKILEQFILHGPSPVESMVDKLPAAVVAPVKAVLDMKTMKHRDVVQKLGSHCANPNTLQNCIHAIATSQPSDYVGTVREDILAGGDNCGRLGFLGAAMGAQAGLDAIPKDWISKTDRGEKVLQMAETLVKLRQA